MSPKYLPALIAALSVLTLAVAAAPGRAAKVVKPAPARPKTAPAATAEEGAIGLVLGMDKESYVAAAASSQTASAPMPQIHATMTFFNHSQTPLRLYIHGAATEWQILDAQGKTVWNSSVGRLIPHNIRVVNLQNSRLRYAQDIPLQIQDGTPLAPGRYTLQGAIPGALGATASLEFNVTH